MQSNDALTGQGRRESACSSSMSQYESGNKDKNKDGERSREEDFMLDSSSSSSSYARYAAPDIQHRTQREKQGQRQQQPQERCESKDADDSDDSQVGRGAAEEKGRRMIVVRKKQSTLEDIWVLQVIRWERWKAMSCSCETSTPSLLSSHLVAGSSHHEECFMQ